MIYFPSMERTAAATYRMTLESFVAMPCQA
jgi:hypothetical protein